MDGVELTGALTHAAGDAGSGASFMATGPLSWLEHMTTGLRGPPASIMMTFLGQMLAQAPQPVHLSLSTFATPSTMWMRRTYRPWCSRPDRYRRRCRSWGRRTEPQPQRSSGCRCNRSWACSAQSCPGTGPQPSFRRTGLTAHDLGDGSSSLGAAGCALVAGHAVHDDALA